MTGKGIGGSLRAPVSATAIADWFVRRAASEPENDLSNLKLQKLIYLAQSLYANRHHIDLVEEQFQAWDNGPAIKPLYGIYKASGASPISTPARLTVIAGRVWPEDIEQALNDVWACFGAYSAWKLREITHSAGPWKHHWRPGVRDIPIPSGEIRDAWPEFEPYSEKPLVARTDNVSAALSRYAAYYDTLPVQSRSEDLSGLIKEMEDTDPLRRRATSLLI